ncbi:MAG TPA: F0F1 ATP synthase subunit delta [Chloroflexota bacterium]|nr:F0F1 ATP synthase subunit delta [Chloroflexota bacterium]
MRPSTTAKRYAEAAFDVARQDGNVESWLSELREAAGTLERSSVTRYFRDPVISHDEKLRTVGELFGSFQPHVLNLLRILALRDRLQLLPQIVAEMENLDRTARGVTEAQVTVARPVDEREIEEIARRLGEATGMTVEVHAHVDPSILGGIVVRIGDRLVDASVAGRLDRLRHDLAV